MSFQIYFINDTKKQVVDTKLLFGDFEDKQQLLCYLSLCNGDSFRIEDECSQWVEDFIYNGKYAEYKHIKLYEYAIYIGDDLYDSSEFERLRNVVDGQK